MFLGYCDMKILLIDDDDALSSFTAAQLRLEGFEVERASNGRQGLDLLDTSPADIVLLDIEMPGMKGLEVIATLRNRGDSVPIVMLTSSEGSAILSRALDGGADDYVTTPFDIIALAARLRAVSRRRTVPSAKKLVYRNIVLDQVLDTVMRGGSRIRLTRVEFRILQALMHRPREVIARSDLLVAIQGTPFDSGANQLAVHMSHLRRKLCAGGLPDPIETVRGAGYRLSE